MAETIPDLRGIPKARAYNELQGHCEAILDGVSDPIAAMATIAALVHHAFGHLWTGFYRVIEPKCYCASDHTRGPWGVSTSLSVVEFAVLQLPK